MPAVAARGSLLARHFQFQRGNVALDVLRREETGKMRANDFGFLVAQQAFRAGVPAGDEPLRVKNHDGVILHVFHKEVKPFFRLDVCLLSHQCCASLH